MQRFSRWDKNAGIDVLAHQPRWHHHGLCVAEGLSKGGNPVFRIVILNIDGFAGRNGAGKR